MLEYKKLIYVGFAFEHHKNTQAGYHHIKDYLEYDKIIDVQWEFDFLSYQTNSLFIRGVRRIYRFLLGDGCPLTVIRCIFMSLLNRNLVFHFIYAENTYKWLHYFKGKTNTIVCTFHQPISYFQNDKYWKKALTKIDKIILMSKKDIDFFRQITGRNNVYFIPHGINTDFYKIDLSINKTIDILLVGNWMRDFIFANDLFKRLISIKKDIKICIVTNHENFKYFSEIENIKLLTNISDNQLRLIYQSSKCLFLPLIEYTANNAILEAAATGCNITVATNRIDISYLDENFIDIIPLKMDNVLNYFKLKISNNFEYSNELAIEKINSNFSWRIISKKTDSTLRN